MPILFKYLTIGLIVSFLFEVIVQKVTDETFTWGERVFMVLLWPIAVIVFLMGIFRNQ